MLPCRVAGEEGRHRGGAVLRNPGGEGDQEAAVRGGASVMPRATRVFAPEARRLPVEEAIREPEDEPRGVEAGGYATGQSAPATWLATVGALPVTPRQSSSPGMFRRR